MTPEPDQTPPSHPDDRWTVGGRARLGLDRPETPVE